MALRDQLQESPTSGRSSRSSASPSATAATSPTSRPASTPTGRRRFCSNRSSSSSFRRRRSLASSTTSHAMAPRHRPPELAAFADAEKAVARPSGSSCSKAIQQGFQERGAPLEKETRRSGGPARRRAARVERSGRHHAGNRRRPRLRVPRHARRPEEGDRPEPTLPSSRGSHAMGALAVIDPKANLRHDRATCSRMPASRSACASGRPICWAASTAPEAKAALLEHPAGCPRAAPSGDRRGPGTASRRGRCAARCDRRRQGVGAAAPGPQCHDQPRELGPAQSHRSNRRAAQGPSTRRREADRAFRPPARRLRARQGRRDPGRQGLREALRDLPSTRRQRRQGRPPARRHRHAAGSTA